MTYSVAKRALNGGFDLGEDGAGCGGGVGGLGDGASNHEVAGSRSDGGGGGGDSLLVADGGACGADSGDYESSFGKGLTHGGHFFGAGDKSANAGLPSHAGETKNLIGGRAGNANGGELGLIHAGEDGDGEEFGSFGQSSGGFGCGSEHGRPSPGVEGEHLCSGAGGGADGSGDGVGDVVEFEVEEDGVSP